MNTITRNQCNKDYRYRHTFHRICSCHSISISVPYLDLEIKCPSLALRILCRFEFMISGKMTSTVGRSLNVYRKGTTNLLRDLNSIGQLQGLLVNYYTSRVTSNSSMYLHGPTRTLRKKTESKLATTSWTENTTRLSGQPGSAISFV